MTSQTFKPDGCSFWPDGDYKDCCDKHDLKWEFGRSLFEKFTSDVELYLCVLERSSDVNAFLMYVGVSTIGLLIWFSKRLKDKPKNND